MSDVHFLKCWPQLNSHGNTLGAPTPAQSQNLKALEEARLRASTVHRARNIGAEATDITQQAAAALLRGGALQAPQVSVSGQPQLSGSGEFFMMFAVTLSCCPSKSTGWTTHVEP